MESSSAVPLCQLIAGNELIPLGLEHSAAPGALEFLEHMGLLQQHHPASLWCEVRAAEHEMWYKMSVLLQVGLCTRGWVCSEPKDVC